MYLLKGFHGREKLRKFSLLHFLSMMLEDKQAVLEDHSGEEKLKDGRLMQLCPGEHLPILTL